jgi:hypothetical protein
MDVGPEAVAFSTSRLAARPRPLRPMGKNPGSMQLTPRLNVLYAAFVFPAEDQLPIPPQFQCRVIADGDSCSRVWPSDSIGIYITHAAEFPNLFAMLIVIVADEHKNRGAAPRFRQWEIESGKFRLLVL